jgi:hypothetical protein
MCCASGTNCCGVGDGGNVLTAGFAELTTAFALLCTFCRSAWIVERAPLLELDALEIVNTVN